MKSLIYDCLADKLEDESRLVYKGNIMTLKKFVTFWYSKDDNRWHASYKNFSLGYFPTKGKAIKLAPIRLAFYLKDTGEFAKRIQKAFKADLEKM